MKKVLIALLIAFLFLLSSCYSNNDVQKSWDEMNDQWLLDYSALEDQYNDAIVQLETISSDIYDTTDYIGILYSYFEQEDNVTFDQAHDAFDSLHSILGKHY